MMYPELLGLVLDPEDADGCRLRACRPLVGPSGDLERELARPQQRDHQPAPQVRRVRLHVAGATDRHQPVKIEVRAPLGALDDVVDLEAAPAATCLAPPAGASASTEL